MIEFQHIKKTYHQKIVIEDFSLKIEDGEFVVLIGPSGCGKTTLLKMVNRLIEPTDGQILMDGNNILKANPIELRRNIGYVIQQTGLFPHMTVRENIELIPLLKKEDPEKIFEKTKSILEIVGLAPEDYMNRYPSQLSGGQQQRVGVARAFATDADVILMDEPFSALDPVTRNALQDEIVQMQKELGKTILFVTHDMDEAIRLADRICLLHEGKIVQYDKPDSILKNPADAFVENFIGKRRIWNNPEVLKARDIMIEDPVRVNKKRSVLQGIEVMKSNHVDSLLVTDKTGILLGLVTLKSLKLKDREEVIENVMENELITVNEADDLIQVLTLMNEKSIGYVPVIDNQDTLRGLITRSSILSALSDQLIDMEVNF